MRPQCPPPHGTRKWRLWDGGRHLKPRRQDVGGEPEKGRAVSTNMIWPPLWVPMGMWCFLPLDLVKRTSYLAVLQISFHFEICTLLLSFGWLLVKDLRSINCFSYPWLANGSAELRQPKQNRAFKLLFYCWSFLAMRFLTHLSHKYFEEGRKMFLQREIFTLDWVPKNVLFFLNRIFLKKMPCG